MAPGMTSAGGMLPDTLDTNKVVVIRAEGKEHAVAVGVTKMSAEEMRTKNKGHGVDTAHYLGDWLVRLLFLDSTKSTNCYSGNSKPARALKTGMPLFRRQTHLA